MKRAYDAHQFLYGHGMACIGGGGGGGGQSVSAQAMLGGLNGRMTPDRSTGTATELTQVAERACASSALARLCAGTANRRPSLESPRFQQDLRPLAEDRSALRTLDRLTTGLQSAAVAPEERKAADYEITALKNRVMEQQQEEQRLQNQLAELSRATSAEQGRWIDFNSRLDELERSLPSGTPR